jgi:hypothetical protein
MGVDYSRGAPMIQIPRLSGLRYGNTTPGAYGKAFLIPLTVELF